MQYAPILFSSHIVQGLKNKELNTLMVQQKTLEMFNEMKSTSKGFFLDVKIDQKQSMNFFQSYRLALF